jgi:60 kDa SS-A/Ro ribonucleoprotein
MFRAVLDLFAPKSANPTAGLVTNHAGGAVFALDAWGRLDRFLILGADGPTYYATARKTAQDALSALDACLALDGKKTVSRIVSVSVTGRAPKNDSAILALAYAASAGDPATRAAALEALPQVARTATHLFHFVDAATRFRGFGRALRTAVARWYTQKAEKDLVYQTTKYRQRDGWSHRDMLRLSHAHPVDDRQKAIFGWIVGKAPDASLLPETLAAFDALQQATSPAEVVQLCAKYRFTHEMIPSQFLANKAVWEALLPDLPLTALLRNLARLGALGLTDAGHGRLIADRLRDERALKKARIHPLSVLAAAGIYGQGRGDKGSLTWKPDTRLIKALDDAFFASFQTIEPTGKRHMLALDVSGSMTVGTIGGLSGVNPRMASAVMAMATARAEAETRFVGFSHTLVPLPLHADLDLKTTVSRIEAVPMGATDCALPMLHAAAQKIPVDVFVVYTDNETWFGNVHPYRALRDYREQTGIAAKLVVVGLTATEFTIADPNDAGTLDVVGFDAAAPAVMADFARQ